MAVSIKKYGITTIASVVAILMIAIALFAKPTDVLSQSATAVTGWAWSDTIGWISLNCSDLGTCATSNYGLSKAANGTLSGYAWSDNVGWVSANAADLVGCPAAPCTAVVSGNSYTGWLKAISGGSTQSGSWDGFVSLSGTGYGLTQSGAIVLGYAWGSDNLGWLDFSAAYPCAATAGYYCSGNTQMYRDNACNTSAIQSCYSCVAGTGQCLPPPVVTGTITASPRLVHSAATSTIAWTTTDSYFCTVTGTNGDAWTGTTGSRVSTTISTPATYTLVCGGPAGTTTVGAVSVVLVPSWQEI